jgi:hypothetical protein
MLLLSHPAEQFVLVAGSGWTGWLYLNSVLIPHMREYRVQVKFAIPVGQYKESATHVGMPVHQQYLKGVITYAISDTGGQW